MILNSKIENNNKIEMDGISFEEFRTQVLEDYRVAYLSRQLSVVGRKEVHAGKAKFGVFGDGKEVPQVAMARYFKKGDWRAGYYRDQTFMLATGISDPDEFFAQLYGDTSIERNPSSGGRSFNNHYGTRYMTQEGDWLSSKDFKNTSADISPTAGQMPRLLGLAYASKLYRNNKELKVENPFSRNGDEVAFGTIGDASTSEGHFFEAMNAAGVLQIPMAISIWDDGYGISVPKKLQTTKESISELLSGFKRTRSKKGILMYHVKGWEYPELCKAYEEGISKARKEHVPVLFHIDELTQPQGHSTSGSHERYKSNEQLQWEKDHDCLVKMREWILGTGMECEEAICLIEGEVKDEVKSAKSRAWKAFRDKYEADRRALLTVLESKACKCSNREGYSLESYIAELKALDNPTKLELNNLGKRVLRDICVDCPSDKLRSGLTTWLEDQRKLRFKEYTEGVYSLTKQAAAVAPVTALYPDEPESVNGSVVLRENFKALFAKDKRLCTFGEDTGLLGDVNQGLEGLQEIYGDLRVTDTGIRETTIIGQGIGMAMRGLRPIAEIQYIDYILYGLQTMSDDLATAYWRTAAGQKVPLIVRTRGHRLEGIWHAGSPMGVIIHSIRGVHVCVPRNMTQAAGFYNTLLKADDPALVVEPLNGYRLKEDLPENLGEFCVPLGVPEIIENGTDVTIVTYGSCVRVAQEAIVELNRFGISAELVDVQTLIPFDIQHVVVESLKKTNRIVFLDEDVPGGTTAYMMQKVLEEQGGYLYLDSKPLSISGHEHRPAYGSDGDYFSNPNADDIFERVYKMMREAYPEKYPDII